MAEKMTFGGHFEEGYMGAQKWVGDNSHRHLYGADLSKAVREAFKVAGLKGVTVSVETYSGGQSLYIKIKASEDCFVSFEEFKEKVPIWELPEYGNKIWYGGRCINYEEMYKMTDDEVEEIYKAVYKRETSDDRQINSSEYRIFTKEFSEKVQKIMDVVHSFNYDDSNGMVDYFDTNFYDWYRLKKTA